MHILVLAGDLTNYYLYKTLKNNNYDVKLEGFNHLLNDKKKAIIIKGYKIIIAPIPLSIDGSMLYSPYSEENIHIDQLFQKADKDSVIIGGPFNFKEDRIYDITKNRTFTDLTVIPTCEEIIKIIIEKSDFTIQDSNIMILGNGRIHKKLSILLQALGAKTEEDVTLKNCNMIVNTSRDSKLGRKELEVLNDDVLIIDVTPGDNFIESKLSKKLNLKIIKARGLPGKSAPQTVSNYIYKTLIKEKLI